MANITADLNITGKIDVTGDLKGTINIGGGKEPVLGALTVKSTGTEQVITPEAGVDGYNSVTVNAIKLMPKEVTPGDSPQMVTADSPYDGLSRVFVSRIQKIDYEINAGMAGNTYNPPANKGFGTLTIKPLQDKTVTPSSQQQVIRCDNYNNYLGLGIVTVEAASGGQKIVCNATGVFSASMKAAFETLENIEKIEFPSVESFTSADLSTIGKNNAVDVYLPRAAGTKCNSWPFNANAAQDAAHKITLHVPADLVSAYTDGSSRMGNWYEFPYSGYDWFDIVGDL